MSGNDSGGSGGGGGGIGRREVAVRCFAAEYDDASLEYSESDEERAPNYVVTPTGARVNRLFVVGVLTEVEPVSDDVLRARVVDPTGAFVVYAGQYQPDAKTFLERAEPPQFVAVTGKARTFEPDDADAVYTSVRPESINAVDADTRDRWTVQTAEQTVDRVTTFAAALERDERGDALAETLRASGVEPRLAAGIPRAIDHYGTTGAYLGAVREMALSAAEVVAGERDEVEPIDLAPDEGGSADVDLAGGVEIAAVNAASGAAASGSAAPEATGTDAAAEAVEATGGTAADSGTTTDSGPTTSDSVAESDAEASAGTTAGETVEAEATAAGDDLGDFDDYGTDEGAASEDADSVADVGETETADEGTGAGTEPSAEGDASDGMYEMDEDEREAIEEEYGTEFSTGGEVDEPGAADIETPGPVEGQETASGSEAATESSGGEGDASAAEAAPAAPEEEPVAPGDEAGVDSAPAEGQVEAEDADEAAGSAEEADDAGETDERPGADQGAAAASDDAEEVDLQDAVVDAMGDLDDGNGADREAVIEAVVDEHGADRGAVEDAIQDALMGGRCYEPEDGRLKAI